MLRRAESSDSTIPCTNPHGPPGPREDGSADDQWDFSKRGKCQSEANEFRMVIMQKFL
jgi:hypothetical protein